MTPTLMAPLCIIGGTFGLMGLLKDLGNIENYLRLLATLLVVYLFSVTRSGPTDTSVLT